MLDILFGADMPLAVRVLHRLRRRARLDRRRPPWLVRRFGGERLGAGAGARTPAAPRGDRCRDRRRPAPPRPDPPRQCRAPADDRRADRRRGRANIVRAAGAPRDAPAAPAGRADTLPRAVPLGEGTMWPLQPEPAPRLAQPRRAPPASRPSQRRADAADRRRLEAGASMRREPTMRPSRAPRAEPRPQRQPAAAAGRRRTRCSGRPSPSRRRRRRRAHAGRDRARRPAGRAGRRTVARSRAAARAASRSTRSRRATAASRARAQPAPAAPPPTPQPASGPAPPTTPVRLARRPESRRDGAAAGSGVAPSGQDRRAAPAQEHPSRRSRAEGRARA